MFLEEKFGREGIFNIKGINDVGIFIPYIEIYYYLCTIKF